MSNSSDPPNIPPQWLGAHRRCSMLAEYVVLVKVREIRNVDILIFTN
jgi:hypothetical protein